jgi:hypothetical protein
MGGACHCRADLAFEEAFDIEIPDEDAQEMRTVRDAILSIQKYRQAERSDEPQEKATR